MTEQRINIIGADITGLDVDAIVNAANPELLPGGGVCGAIHDAAGPGLAAECAQIPGGCPTGEARITHGYDLKAPYVIHAVGPIWSGGVAGEPDLLAQCYRRALGLCVGNNLTSIAFPAISTGIYGFPADRAAEIAVNTVADFLRPDDRLKQVVFCCFGEVSIKAHEAALAALDA
ncbi:MAG: O-acetyl-ADP-ribose deacetylase [Rhodospirillaceae bacterium]|jgi:O-acetyl-ADP-ribose deacetylase|nr:O-acetyl-ADP-ribose deacetylase [Rhodospirillaceae bacterium]MBT4220266.1 O-acetyl-ADP-ribose deacetylase [Rhodospirillaceae bacterium]MBT5308419.1 O-acetyl-ADP-ribose deacetylase [Rhodospirillaceae bacterium]MBT6406621.1 O-acetyl-ADP-ribose deacetylase [Rhodospirillaceae bacterium]MBT7356511.1 O-acetyl-ADP-ribose deacetylase [Rhodospirillaceae bacterium]